ncbi:hypothetical protein JCM16303_007347 [Sporobolomyces ruberrimus]
MPLSTLKLFTFSRSRRPSPKPNPTDPLDCADPLDRSTLLHDHVDSFDRLADREKSSAGVGHLLMGHSSPPTPRTIRSRSQSSNPSAAPSSRDSPIRTRSSSRRRYQLPKESQERIDGCPYCPDARGNGFTRGHEGTARSKGAILVVNENDSRRGSDSSVESLKGAQASARPATTNRPPLFDDDVDDLEVDRISISSTSSSDDVDDEDEEEEGSLCSYNSPPTSSYSLGRSSSTRKSSLSTTATSDPLISPSSVPSVPVLSFGSPSHQRPHWLPATRDKIPAPSAESQFAPSLPDAPAPPPAIPLSTSPEKNSSPLRRASSLTSFSPSRPSLLSKSLRSLASLPNLTLPNLLPQLPRPDIYLTNSDSQSPTLKSGWGARERRRVLDSEPSWDADEARGLLSRRSKRSLSNDSSQDGDSSQSETNLDTDLALSDLSTPITISPPPSPTLSDTDTVPLSTPLATPLETPLPPPAPPPQRFISNTRHLLMLSIEFSMMRADKISSPLRPRAVIVRSGSPTRGGVSGLGSSGLRNEIFLRFSD